MFTYPTAPKPIAASGVNQHEERVVKWISVAADEAVSCDTFFPYPLICRKDEEENFAASCQPRSSVFGSFHASLSGVLSVDEKAKVGLFGGDREVALCLICTQISTARDREVSVGLRMSSVCEESCRNGLMGALPAFAHGIRKAQIEKMVG